MKVGDRLLSASRGTAPQAIGAANAHGALRFGEVTAYANEAYRLAPLLGLDASIAIAQSAHETAYWTSDWWVNRLNPAGIGITGDPVENAASPTFATGTESAWAQLSHLLVYALGPVDAGSVWHRATGTSIASIDSRYDDYLAAYGNTVRAVTIKGLSGTWATDKLYAEGIVSKGVAIYPTLPDQSGGTVADITFGRVPHPAVDIRDIPNNTAWDNLGKRTVRAICWHRMLGTLWGTDSWFRGGGSGSALTDYGLGVAAADGAGEAGHLMRWNDPRGERSPWANGPVSEPYGDGEKFVALYGVNGVNRDATSLEISGQQTTPLDEKSRQKIAELTAYWADQYRIPWNAFPLVAAENGRSFVIYHREFTIGTGKLCPFQVVMDETDDLIARAKAIMQAAQTGGSTTTPTTTPAPVAYPPHRIPAPDELSAQGHALTVNAPNRFECIQGTTFRTAPSLDAPAAAKTPAKAGRSYTFDFSTKVGADVWLVSKAGSWALARAFTPVETR